MVCAAGLVGIVAGLAAGAAARAAGATWEVPYQVGAGPAGGRVRGARGLARSMAKRPERGLLVLLAAAGVMLCAFTPLYTHVSWDDHIHYDRAVATSYLIDPEYTLGDAALVGRAYDDVARFAREPERAGWIDPFDVQRLQQHYARIDELGAATEGAVRLDGAVTLRGVGIVEYYTVAYIPAAVGLWTARLLALSTTQGFLLGRLATFACYALLAYFACKRLKSGKMVLAACAMVPTAVFLASGYSYDFWLIGFLMLGFSLFVGELQRPDEPLRWRWFLLMVAAFLLGLGPKAVYVPIAAMLLFMPRSKFAKPVGARRRRGGLRAGGAGAASAVAAGAQDARVCAGAPAGCLCAGGAAGGAAPGVAASAAPAAGVSPAAGAPWGTPALTHRRYLLVVFASALFVLATFVLPFFVAGPGEGDARGGAVNPGAQVAFILHDPAGYAGVFGRFLEGYVALRNAEFALTDFCGLETAHVERMVAVLLLAVALTDRRACDPPLRHACQAHRHGRAGAADGAAHCHGAVHQLHAGGRGLHCGRAGALPAAASVPLLPVLLQLQAFRAPGRAHRPDGLPLRRAVPERRASVLQHRHRAHAAVLGAGCGGCGRGRSGADPDQGRRWGLRPRARRTGACVRRARRMRVRTTPLARSRACRTGICGTFHPAPSVPGGRGRLFP